jgi:hypothetical protein
MWQDRKVCKVLVGMPMGKKPLGRQVKMVGCVQNRSCGDWLEWIKLAQDRDW